MIFAPLIEYLLLFTCIYKKQVSKNSLLYVSKLINNYMTKHIMKNIKKQSKK